MPESETAPGGASSLPYDVFISYAHEDSEFVARLRAWLEAAGFNVWLDEERMRAGGPLQEQIYRALLNSEQAVFVLSEASVESRWLRYELGAFSREAAARRKIAILRSPLSPGRMPVELVKDTYVRWHDGREPDLACFWLLYCGLRSRPPGKREAWEQEGRRVCRQAGSGLMPATPAEEEWSAARTARWGHGRAVWGCDRNDQWMKIETHAAKPEHEALFVVGPRGEGHNFFLDAVEECFPGKPEDRWIRKVSWGAKIPGDRAGFLRDLGRALLCPGPESAALAGSLRALLRDRNLVLVHRPVMPARLRDQALTLYYTRWLPELLPEPGATRGALKVVQGIDWPPFALSKALSTPAAGETRKALQEIRGAADARLPVFLLPPLKPITRKHVRSWAEALPKHVVEEPGELVRDVLEGARHSADVLARIVERLCAAEERA